MADLGDARPQDDGRARGIGRAGAIVGELADAVGSALLEVAEEQGGIAADRVAAIAEAVRCAARSCDQSGSPAMARGVDRAADGIDDIAGIVRRRDWREIAAETADFARRRPGLFGLGAISIGFLVGRLLTLPSPPAADGADGGPPYRETP
jgi:hypothetical protein